MQKLIALSFSKILKAHIPGIIVSIVVVVGITVIHWLMLDLPPGVLLVMEILIGAIGFILSVLLKPPRLLKEVILHNLAKLKGSILPNWWSGRILNWYYTRILSG
jgi:hypothetical protein